MILINESISIYSYIHTYIHTYIYTNQKSNVTVSHLWKAYIYEIHTIQYPDGPSSIKVYIHPNCMPSKFARICCFRVLNCMFCVFLCESCNVLLVSISSCNMYTSTYSTYINNYILSSFSFRAFRFCTFTTKVASTPRGITRSSAEPWTAST
jgi:hypothetical protein